MSGENKITVALVCQVSNPEIRANLTYSKNIIDLLLRKILHKPRHLDDYGQWITNAIEEFDLSRRTAGVYLLHLTSDGAIQTWKIIKRN